MDSLFDLAKKTVKEIQNRSPRFRLVIANPQMVNISFWYIPPSLRQTIENEERILQDGHTEEGGVLKMGPLSQQTKESLHRVAPEIKAKLMESGGTMVGFQPLDEKPNFFSISFESSFHEEYENNDSPLTTPLKEPPTPR